MTIGSSDTETPLAHSARDKALEAQSYREHLLGSPHSKTLTGVLPLAEAYARLAVARHTEKNFQKAFIETVRLAAEYHDLGKLLHENQRTLSGEVPQSKLPTDHVDAGVVHMLEQRIGETALCIFSHHRGLPNFNNQIARGNFMFRTQDAEEHGKAYETTNDQLPELLKQHHQALETKRAPIPTQKAVFDGLSRRMALSCLVDADHSDTAHFYGEEPDKNWPRLEPEKRLEALRCCIKNLSDKADPTSEQTHLRNALFEHCRCTSGSDTILYCDAPVGSGKTTAVMAHLLHVAAIRGLEKIFVVLPYTNIINQSVTVLRDALTLSGENPKDVVIAHHHRVEFAGEDEETSLQYRRLTFQWHAPIIVTTAVQFFETLSACKTTPLRKLHRIPNSAIMVDEAHASMPIHLWRQYWVWVRELAKNWGCHWVLSSGSLVKFWDCKPILENKETIPSLIDNEELNKTLRAFDKKRLHIKTHPQKLNADSLCAWILEHKGPRIVVLNTVSAAGIIADKLKKQLEEDPRPTMAHRRVLHLSTALCPKDREPIVKEIERRLKETPNHEWTLVATSCVEAGMDFSFQTGFRERCSLVSLIQLSGRVNRSSDRLNDPVLWDFQTQGFAQHPDFRSPSEVLGELFRKGKITDGSTSDITQLATESLQREIQIKDREDAAKSLVEAEKEQDYPKIADLARLIKTDTRTVLIDDGKEGGIVHRLKSFEPVSANEIQNNSVQIWFSEKLFKQLDIEPLKNRPEFYRWKHAYDPHLLGYMAGVLRMNLQDDKNYCL